MYFRERLFTLESEKVFAISLFKENLVHLHPSKDTFNQGYAYIMDTHTMEKKDILPLCTRILPADQHKAVGYLRSAEYAPKSNQEKYQLFLSQ